MSTTNPVQIFYSYAHEDEALRDDLDKHFAALRRQGYIESWHDRRIGPGKEWANEISEHLKNADIILLLVSKDLIASDYCYDVEVKMALMRHSLGEARAVPIVLKPTDWKDTPIGKLQALPTDAKAVTKWGNRDEAFNNVVKGLKKVIKEIRQPTIDSKAEKEIQLESSDEETDGFQHADPNSDGGVITITGTTEIELNIDRDFDKFTDKDKIQLLKAVGHLLEIPDSEIRITRIRRGSVKVTMRLTPVQAERLLWASKNGSLDEVGVIDAEIKSRTTTSRTAALDSGNIEVQVALLSTRIKELTEHLKSHTKDHSTRRGLIMMVNKRRKLLTYLHKKDDAKYKELIAKLGLRK